MHLAGACQGAASGPDAGSCAGSGLSSSSALICSAVLAVLTALGSRASAVVRTAACWVPWGLDWQILQWDSR